MCKAARVSEFPDFSICFVVGQDIKKSRTLDRCQGGFGHVFVSELAINQSSSLVPRPESDDARHGWSGVVVPQSADI